MEIWAQFFLSTFFLRQHLAHRKMDPKCFCPPAANMFQYFSFDIGEFSRRCSRLVQLYSPH